MENVIIENKSQLIKAMRNRNVMVDVLIPNDVASIPTTKAGGLALFEYAQEGLTMEADIYETNVYLSLHQD